jgi:hypothetical protein
MKAAHLKIFTLIALGFLGIAFLLCVLFRAEIISFILSQKTYILIAVPIFFIVGLFLFFDDKWSIISLLSFACLLFLAINCYIFIAVSITPSTSVIHNNDTGPGYADIYIIRFFIAEFTFIVLLIGNGIKNYVQDKKETEILHHYNKPLEYKDEE